MHRDFGYIEEEKLRQTYDFKLLVRLAKYLRPYRSYLVFSILLVLVITGVELLLPYLTKVAIDNYILVTARRVRLPAEDAVSQEMRKEYGTLLTPIEDSDVFFINEDDLGGVDHRLLFQLKKRGWMDDTRYYPAPLGRHTLRILSKIIPRDFQRSETKAFIRYDDLAMLPGKQLLKLRQRDLTGVTMIGAVFVFLLLVGFLASYGQIYYMEYTGQKVMHDLRLRLCSHIQGLSLTFFDRNPVGKLVTRATNDIQNLQDMFSSIIVQSFKDLVLLLGIMVVMLLLNWRLALVCFALVPAVLVLTILFSIKAREAFRSVRNLIAGINSYIHENFSGILVVKIFRREKENIRRFRQINHDHYLANIRQILVFAIFMPAIEVFGSLCIALLLWQGGEQVISQALSLGVLVAFLSYIQKMYQPVRFLAEKYNIMQSALASAERIFFLLDEEANIPEPPASQAPSPVQGGIAFENVVFAYNEGEPVLRDVSFGIEPGKTVAVVGATGAGKSTLIKLLVRFYDVQGGRILLDGVDIRSIDKSFLRSQIGLVLQDAFLFAETIAYNIRLGSITISDRDLEKVASMVNADRFINKRKEGLEETISEEGGTLSAGERQLLSFARALAFDPAILVLDEATSNIDPETERLIQNALIQLTRQRTSLIIAHRLSTIQRADRILVLHKGQIREQGTHDELMAKKGIYYRLYQLQYQ